MRIGDEEVHFRDFRPGDEEQIVALYDAAFGEYYPATKSVDDLDYLRWFIEPHDSHQTRIIIAEVGTRIANSTGRLYRPIKVGQRTLHGRGGGLGGATHPDFQRKGIYAARSEWSRATEDPAVAVGLSRRRAVIHRLRDNPVASHGRIGVYLYVQRPWRAASARKAGLAVLNALPATGMALWSRLRSRVGPRGARNVTVSTLPAFDERYGPFLERASAAWDVIPMRSVEYLNWRFCDPRAGGFVVRAAEQGDTLLGYAVLHRLEGRGHIMDLLALPDRLDVVRTLIDDAIQHLDDAGTHSVECWMLREQPYARVLRQAGFVLLQGRSAEEDSQIAWEGPGLTAEDRALLMSADARVHLVRRDFDGI